MTPEWLWKRFRTHANRLPLPHWNDLTEAERNEWVHTLQLARQALERAALSPEPLADDDLSELEERAKEATPGPWRAEVQERGHRFARVISPDGHAIHYKYGSGIPLRCDQEGRDARYIAAANPSAILSLLETITSLQEENRRLREALEELEDANEALCRTRSQKTYLHMIDGDKAQPQLERLDAARRIARLALSQEGK